MSQWIDLVMDNGELVRVEIPNKHEGAVLDAIEHTMKRRDWFAPGAFEGCSAEYLGLRLDRVNMGRVVAALR